MTGTSHRIAAIVVAAGRGARAGEGGPKQYRGLGGKPVLRHSVEALVRHPRITEVLVVTHAEDVTAYEQATEGLTLLNPAFGGETRQESVLNGLECLAESPPDFVLIHDAARPFLPASAIDRLIDALAESDGAVPALPVVDSLRRGDSHVEGEVDRAGLYRVQTPQAFRFAEILRAHRAAGLGATDDVEIARKAGLRVAIVEGDERMSKLTFEKDFEAAEMLLTAQFSSRTGLGYDVHRFGPGDHVWLCGIKLPHDRSLIGHSDADVGLHALTDAILGAAAEGDIGDHFPPGNEEWRGASSGQFVEHARNIVTSRGGTIDHVDITVICETPRIGPHREAMRTRVASLLRLPLAAVSIKATTTEQLGFTGRSEGIAAQAVATVRLPKHSEPDKTTVDSGI